LDYNRAVKVLFLFLLVYAFIYILTIYSPLHTIAFSGNIFQTDYLFFSLPIAGYFMMYFAVGWLDSYFGNRFGHSPVVPVALIVLSIPAYFVVLFWYFQNLSQLAGQEYPVFDFWQHFIDSPFIIFVISALGGWLSRIALDDFFK
jgi:hypothetical protein